ncbi:hypothetical protein ACUZXZ_13500 [Pseudomonas juntendi]|nr:hypothetical protein [Pseudomonas juntendi]UJM10287.1 hypothetical protein L1P09_13020 [Pseudomonas juntendi]
MMGSELMQCFDDRRRYFLSYSPAVSVPARMSIGSVTSQIASTRIIGP